MKKEISEQLYLVTNGPLDAKVSPVDNVSDLLAIPRAHRYRGMTVMVLNKDSEEEACEYWLKDGTKDSNWVKKTKESPQFDPTDYYTSAQTDAAISEAIEEITGSTTSAETVELIAQAIATETARTEATYLKEHQSLADYYTSAQTDSAINEAIGDIDLTNYYTSAQTDNKITEAVSAITVSGVTRQELNDAMAAETARTEATYLKEHQSLADFYTSAETDNAISEAVADATTSAETAQLIAEAIATETARTEETYLKEHQSLDDYYTSAQTDNAIATAMAAETARTETTYLKEHQSLADYYTSAQTESAITSAITEVMSVIEEDEEVSASALNELNTRFEDYYTSAQTDTAIQNAVSGIDLSDYYTSAQTDSAITEAVKDFATEEYVDSAITSLQKDIDDSEEVISAALNDLHSGITAINEALESAVTSADVQEAIEGAMADETARTETTYLKKEAIENYYTSAQTDSAIQEAISGATFDEYATKEYVTNQMAAETARTEAAYIKQVSVEEDGFYIVDENGYIALSVTDEGVNFADKINTELVSNNEYDINI